MAAAYLDALPDAVLGSVRLRDDQRRIVARARRALERDGGCLVADDVGRGKTFAALALAKQWQHTLVVAPAALRATWRDAASRTGVSCTFASHDSLSRGMAPTVSFNGIVVDESHHFRTTTTRRYDMLVKLSASAPVVLLSATPLQNRARDLAAQLALFIGDVAFTLSVAELAAFVSRGDDALPADQPVVRPPVWVTPESDDGDVLRAILALAAPPRPLDGGDAGALRTIGLVRAWASSRAALQATMRQRLRVAVGIEQGLETGRVPSRAELRAWHSVDDAVQLGFASLLIETSRDAGTLRELGEAVRLERNGVQCLAEILRATPDPDITRATAIRAIRARHAASRIIAFSEYASTVRGLFALLRTEARVGVLTAGEARIASGRVPREELLTRFAPVAQRIMRPHPRDAVTLLLATDLLSEGVNLQDANVVIHLDLPWNPARLAQRVGRVRRLGGESEVMTYLLAPPASAQALLDAERRLRTKLDAACAVVGAGFSILPSETSAHGGTRHGEHLSSSATGEGAFVSRLSRWLASGSSAGVHPIVAGVSASASGWLAALSDGRIVGTLGDTPSDDRTVVHQLGALVEGDARAHSPQEATRALACVARMLETERLASLCGLEATVGPLRQRALRSTAYRATRLSRSQRAIALPLIARRRSALRLPAPLGLERLLVEQLECTAGNRDVVDDLRWAVQRIESAPRRGTRQPSSREETRVRAIVLFGA